MPTGGGRIEQETDTMAEAVIVEAQRSPIARGKKGKGELSGLHPATLFGKVLDGVVEKAGVDPAEIEQHAGFPEGDG